MSLPKLLLASKSPRRQEILEKAGFEFEVVRIDADESFPEHLKGPEVCCYLSEWKSNHYQGDLSKAILVTADTIVVIDEHILNKPASESEAFNMLQQLNGRCHEVFTGVTLRFEDKKHTFYERTEVCFHELTEIEIRRYIQNCRPFDKAGSYGIQDWMGIVGVKHINGCFYNVMGFPAARFYREIAKILD